MNRPTQAWLALCIVPLCVASGASAQEDKWGDKPVDLKALIAPVRPLVPVPLPRDYQFNSGSIGGSQAPAAPLQSPGSSGQSAPGFRLTIPAR